MRFFKKLLKVVGFILVGLPLTLIVLINIFFKPMSDEEIFEEFSEAESTVFIKYNEFNNQKYRVITTQYSLDTTLPNLVFVHGSPGSAMDYKRYLLDDELNSKANVIAYDRVGYGVNNLGAIGTIAEETALLNKLMEDLEISKTILFGYSYGGPIALASKKEYQKIVLCAPAVYSVVEPMFWFLNFYKWGITRWMLPRMLQTASKEKLQHQKDLKSFEQHWGNNPSSIYVIHGDKDWIVPFENSIYIQKQFPEDQFELVTVKEASHDLIWSRYDEIKKELIKVIEE